MATFFRNTVVKNVGRVPVKVLETTASQRATVLGISFTNLTDKFVYCDVEIQSDDSVRGFYLKDSVLPSGTSLRAVSTGEKLVLDQNNTMKIKSSVENSIDVIASYAEIV